MVDGSFRYSQIYDVSCFGLGKARVATVLKGWPVMQSISIANAAFSSLPRVSASTNWGKDSEQERDSESNA